MTKANLFFVVFIPFLAGVLIFLWFKDGYMMGTAEGVIPFYNLGRNFDQVKHAWANNTPGLGQANGILTAYAPTFFALSSIEKLGSPAFLTEASVFWFLFTNAGLSIFFLGKILFPKLPAKYLLLGSLFYWFNFISLVTVWHRFLYNFMFFWSFIPLGVVIYLLGLTRQKYFYVLALALSTVIFSYAFSVPVFDCLFWFLIIFITVFWIIFKGSFREKKFFLKFFVLSLVCFVIFNFWWIGQIYSYVSSGDYEVNKTVFFIDKFNYTTFSSLSKTDGKLIYITRLMHGPFFEEPRVSWASFYINALSQTLEFSIIGICFFIIYRFRNNFSVLFLSTGLFTSFFLVKGNSPPLGEILNFLFKEIPILEFFRDPFEKFGYLMPVFLSPLLAFSFYEVLQRFNKNISKLSYILILLIIFMFYGYPFVSGLVFIGSTPPTNDYDIGYKVKVPDYYKQASDWLETQGKNFRLLGMPFRDQGVTYKWEKGYQGVEPSSLLFSTPYIMVNTTVLYYNDVAAALERLLINSVNFTNVLNILNIRYLMVREDIDYRERAMRNPESIVKLLTEGEIKQAFLKSVDFGKLKFWEVASWYDNTFYTATDALDIFPKANIEDTTLDEFNKGSVLISSKQNNSLSDFASKLIIYPKSENSDFNLGVSTQTFELSNSGEYDIILSNPEITSNDIPLLEFKPVIIDDTTKLNLVKVRNDGRFFYGTIKLSAGIHKVTAPILESANCINDADQSFIVNKGAKKVGVVDFNPFAKYIFNFKYLSSNPSVFRIDQDTDRVKKELNIPTYERVLSPIPVFNLYNANLYQEMFEPIYTSSEMQLEFQPAGSDLHIQDLLLKKVFKPNVILIISKRANLTQPQINYIKYNHTKYKISVKNSQGEYILVFSELYNPGWELRLADGETLDNHFLANAYANGWKIDKEGDYNLIVEFAPQRSLNTGIIISTLAFGTGLFYLLFRFGKFLITRKN